MKLVSHAQNFEDVLLWRVFRDVQNGRYIDVGAHDPVIDSVSLSFYEAGWRGLHVEPLPDYAARLRAARPEEAVIEAAVSDSPGPIFLFELGGLSTGRQEIAERHARAGDIARRMFVPAVRLDHLLGIINDEVHWLKVDVEGMEAEVLRSWGESDIRPWVLVIEATLPNTQEPTQHLWIDEVLRRGYEQVFFDGLSCYFLHEQHHDLSSRFAAPANVFDSFDVTIDHFSASTIRGELQTHEQQLSAERARAEQLAAELAESERIRDLAAHEKDETIERLVAAEQTHRSAIEGLEQELRREIHEAEESAASARVEVARLEERSVQLQDKLDRADEELQRRQDLLTDAHSSLVREQQETDRLRVELGAQIGELGATLARANELIRSAACERPGAWQRIGESIGLARRGPALRALAAWQAKATHLPGSSPADNQPTVPGTETIMHSPAPMAARNPYLRANSLAELLAWHDVDFVRCAFVTVLGRQPDAEGEAYYSERIRCGHSKMQVLWQLRKSPEGSGHDPGIAGLDRALRRAHRARLPMLGGLFRLLNREEGDSAADRRRRAIANDLGVLRAAQEAQMCTLQSHSAGLKRLEKRLEAIGVDIAAGGPQSRTSGLPSAGDNAIAGRGDQRDLLDPIDLSAAETADQAISIVKSAINVSREVQAFRLESRPK